MHKRMSKMRHHDRHGDGPRGMDSGRVLAARLTRDAGDKPLQCPGRRKGTVLIFVVAILGVLFVSGIAFLTSVNFEAKALQIEKHAGEDQAGVAQIERIIEEALVESFVSGPGQTGGQQTLSEFLLPSTVQNPETVPRIRVHRPTWTELPGVHGLISPLEPHAQGPLFAQPTNFNTLRRGTITRRDNSQSPSVDRTIELGLFSRNVAFTQGVLNTSLQNDIQDFDGTNNLAPFERSLDDWDALAVDSDGDGIVDTRQYRLFHEDLPAEQFDAISRVVNDPANPLGRVYVGARVIPHGAMVNLNDGHPNLLRAVLAFDWIDEETEFLEAIEETNAGDNRHGPYLPAAEEPMLRRRFMFPPAEMATTGVQGDPADLATNDPPGGGDFGTKLFPVSSFFPTGETVYKDGHQYWPFGYSSPNNDHEVWEIRMNPASDPATYDRRHRVTTVSHDDLITRGAAIDVYELVDGTTDQIEVDLITNQPLLDRNVDVLDLMRAVARGTECSEPATFGYEGLPFESLDYPHTVTSAQRILNDHPDPLDNVPGVTKAAVSGLYSDPGPVISWCECEQDSFQTGCRADVRKGRLRLSLPWLDEHMTSDPNNRTVQRPITVAMRNNLIYEAFEMMLLGARPQSNPNPGTGWGGFQTMHSNNLSTDLWVRTPGEYRNISETAASLTANMIDFKDDGDEPTRIAVRNFELRAADWVPADHGGVLWEQAIGRPYGGTDDFVYGLERQPYITEITAYVQEGANPGEADPAQSGYAVELFNPNNVPIDIQSSTGDYLLRFADGTEIPLVKDIPAKGHWVLYVDAGAGQFGLTEGPGFERLQPPDDFSFLNGDTIYLIRRQTYTTSVSTDTVDIVLDEFQVGGDVAQPLPTAEIWTLERRGVSVAADFGGGKSPWFAPFPADPADAFPVDPLNAHSLGEDESTEPISANVTKFPVEVYTADTGTFASAFPTTGSMLLLMRFANLGVDNIANLAPGMAFTTHLEDDFLAGVGGPDGTYALDNGRMPVFDTLNLHHVPADSDGTVAGGMWQAYRPGEPMHLPWGQLLFDYFTALPLENEGPYRGSPGPGGQVDPAAQARVDMGGLRVHGRININAAPWIVMQGLPLMPMDSFNYDGSGNHPVHNALKNALLPVDLNGDAVADDESGVLGRSRAMAIAAYRDVRNIGATGDYGDNGTTTSRGWNDAAPEFRRGTGFLSVGELANVRHIDAGAAFRLDSGMVVDNSSTLTVDSPYLDAIAVLVSLGDWVTVRSHVFTIYGTVRGGTPPDPDGNPVNVLDHLDEVNERAMRFQKTIDRLPTFMGRTRPETIGDSVIARYSDVLND